MNNGFYVFVDVDAFTLFFWISRNGNSIFDKFCRFSHLSVLMKFPFQFAKRCAMQLEQRIDDCQSVAWRGMRHCVTHGTHSQANEWGQMCLSYHRMLFANEFSFFSHWKLNWNRKKSPVDARLELEREKWIASDDRISSFTLLDANSTHQLS